MTPLSGPRETGAQITGRIGLPIVTPEMDRLRAVHSAFGCATLFGVRVPILAVVLLVAACSVNSTADEEPAGPASTTLPSSSAPSAASTTTTEPPPSSSALIRIGPARYELDAICAAGGAGEIEVSVSGTDVNGLPVIGYVRAFLGAPYVSLQVGEGDDAVLFEPRLEGVLPFDLTDTGVVFTEVDFVTDLELATGEFTPAGLGVVEVVCVDYVRELPPIPFEN